ncbi:MAG: DUF359 domain-containing protein [Microgenomates group bacterium]
MTRTHFPVVGLGGTFDHFHKGHQDFIRFAANLGDSLVIGVTDDLLPLSKPFAEILQPHWVRIAAVRKFCTKEGIEATCLILHDAFGPTIEESRISALAVTTDTLSGADAINTIREKLYMPALPVYVHSLTLDSGGLPISSNRIRSGEISREGVVYSNVLSETISLSSSQRDFFTLPQGQIVTEPSIAPLICVVGDVCLSNFRQNDWQYDLGIFDLRTRRQASILGDLDTLFYTSEVSNSPGEISRELTRALQAWKHNSFQHLKISGEEDLATVALAMILPLESHIYYGQPEKGMIELIVTEELKNTFHEQLQKKNT